jgi:hypothetical protein
MFNLHINVHLLQICVQSVDTKKLTAFPNRELAAPLLPKTLHIARLQNLPNVLGLSMHVLAIFSDERAKISSLSLLAHSTFLTSSSILLCYVAFYTRLTN